MAQTSDTHALTRRAVLGGLGLGLIGSPNMASASAVPEIGVQLWTLDAELRADLDGTLALLRGLGVRAVETAGLLGLSAIQFRAALARADLACAACHCPQAALEGNLAKQVEDAVVIGAQFLVCSSPEPKTAPRQGADWSQGLADAMTLSDWERTAETLNRTGQACAPAGLRAAYHNHGFEFARYDGRQALDVLVQSTEAALVDFELDVGWTFAGGADPIQTMNRLGPRLRLLHLKNVQPGGPGRWRSRPVSDGGIDWRGVMGTATALGVPLAFVEQDPPFDQPPLDGLRASLTYLLPLGTSAARFEDIYR